MILPVDMVLVVVLPSRLRTYTQADQSVGTKKMVPQRKDVCTYSIVVGLHSVYEALD